jgi:hypothetical protein
MLCLQINSLAEKKASEAFVKKIELLLTFWCLIWFQVYHLLLLLLLLLLLGVLKGGSGQDLSGPVEGTAWAHALSRSVY